eukprot:3249024-Pleurochrysis_carterae.AAC.2
MFSQSERTRPVQPERVDECDRDAGRSGHKMEFGDGREHTVDGVHSRAREEGGVAQRKTGVCASASRVTALRRQTYPLDHQSPQRYQQETIKSSRARSDCISKSRRDESQSAHAQHVPTVVCREHVHHSRGDGCRQEHDVRDEGHHRPDPFGIVCIWPWRRGRAVGLVLDARFRGRVRRARDRWGTCSNFARRFTRRLSGVKAAAQGRVRRRKVRDCTRFPGLPWPPRSTAPSAPSPFPGRSRHDRHPPALVERNPRRAGTSATGSLSPCTPRAGVRFTGVVTPVHVVLSKVADGDAGSTLDVAVARKPVVMCAPDKVAELAGIELRARPCSCESSLRVVQYVAAVRKQSLAEIEWCELFHPAQREQSVGVVVGSFCCKRLALGSAIINLFIVDVDCFEPRSEITD